MALAAPCANTAPALTTVNQMEEGNLLLPRALTVSQTEECTDGQYYVSTLRQGEKVGSLTPAIRSLAKGDFVPADKVGLTKADTSYRYLAMTDGDVPVESQYVSGLAMEINTHGRQILAALKSRDSNTLLEKVANTYAEQLATAYRDGTGKLSSYNADSSSAARLTTALSDYVTLANTWDANTPFGSEDRTPVEKLYTETSATFRDAMTATISHEGSSPLDITIAPALRGTKRYLAVQFADNAPVWNTAKIVTD